MYTDAIKSAKNLETTGPSRRFIDLVIYTLNTAKSRAKINKLYKQQIIVRMGSLVSNAFIRG